MLLKMTFSLPTNVVKACTFKCVVIKSLYWPCRQSSGELLLSLSGYYRPSNFGLISRGVELRIRWRELLTSVISIVCIDVLKQGLNSCLKAIHVFSSCRHLRFGSSFF